MNIFTYKNSKFSRGYTLLFAVLTATLVLGVAVFILGVSRKQLALAVAARDSMFSLYAADSGIECAAAAFSIGDLATSSPAEIKCAGETYSPTWTYYSTDGSWTKVYKSSPAYIDLADGTCAKVTIADGYINGKNVVSIESRGYNYCDGEFKPQTSTRTVERALELTYQ